MTSNRKIGRLPLMLFGAISVMGLAVAGFWLVEAYLPVRLLFAGLAVVAAVLTIIQRDRVLLSLLTMHGAVVFLLSFLLTQTIPSVVIFSILAFLTAFLIVFITGQDTPEKRLLAAGGGLIIAQFIWLISPWPFDPASKAAIVTIFFYALAVFMRKEQPIAVSVAGSFWILVVLFVIINSASWQI